MTSHKKYIEGAAFIKIALDPRVAWAFLRRDTGFLQSDRAFGETVTPVFLLCSSEKERRMMVMAKKPRVRKKYFNRVVKRIVNFLGGHVK